MSINISLHGLSDVTHGQLSKLTNDVVRLSTKGGSRVNVYVPRALAARFAQAWQDAKDAGEV